MGKSTPLDKLVVQFCKALNMDLREELLPPMPPGAAPFGGPWMTLGYFDAMQIYPLSDTQGSGESGNWLGALWNHNIKLSEKLNGLYYVHPFHIMADLSKAPKRDEYRKFWEKPSKCLFITLTQGVPQRGENGVCPDRLERQIREQLQKRKSTVSQIFYRTLELSDLVIIWKSDSVAAILERMQELYQQPFIGDLNTFCGIGYSALTEAYEKDGAAKSPEIPRISMRFNTKSAQKSQLVFDELRKFFTPEPYFVTGTEDLHIIWNGASENTFYRVLHHCFLDEPDDQKFRKTFQDAFREVDTHIGIPVSAALPDSPMEPSLLTKRCQKLLRTFSAIDPTAKNPENECDYSWMKAIRNQLNEMVDMSQSYVVDGLCYLALDSVSLFCDEMEARLSQDKPLTSKEVEGIQRFVRGWGILTEQAGRADGRFTHLPGFSPPLYDIPSSLLEFYLAFTKQCSRILQSGGRDASKFAMLIVPKLCRRIKVQSVLNFRDPPCPRLLYVDIPLDTLYDPFTVLCQLVHEMSHFCGERWRNRKSRTDYYLVICAYELAMALGLDTKANVASIKNDLSLECRKAEYYLSDLESEACGAMINLVRDSKKFSSWMELCSKKLTFEEPWQEYGWKDWCVSHRAMLLSGYSDGPLIKAIRNITDLFKECYADVSMIRTLSLDFEDYMRLSLKETRLYGRWLRAEGPSEDIDPKNYYNIVLRWTAVCKAVFGDVSTHGLPNEQPLQRFFQDICHCLRYIDGQLDSQSTAEAEYINSPDSLSLLIDYLKECNGRMKNEFPLDTAVRQDLELLRNAFGNIARKHIVECDSCNSLVSNYERIILQ